MGRILTYSQNGVYIHIYTIPNKKFTIGMNSRCENLSYVHYDSIKNSLQRNIGQYVYKVRREQYNIQKLRNEDDEIIREVYWKENLPNQ